MPLIAPGFWGRSIDIMVMPPQASEHTPEHLHVEDLISQPQATAIDASSHKWTGVIGITCA